MYQFENNYSAGINLRIYIVKVATSVYYSEAAGDLRLYRYIDGFSHSGYVL